MCHAGRTEGLTDPIPLRSGDLVRVRALQDLMKRKIHRLDHFERIEEPFSISFRQLSLKIGPLKKETTIINEIDGVIHPKSICSLVSKA